MIREALVFHYLDDLDSKLAAARAALALDTGEPEWSAYSGALGRKFLRLDQFLKPDSPKAKKLKPKKRKPIQSFFNDHRDYPG
jgi:hypothetical protein